MLLWIIILLLLVTAALLFFAARFFFRYTFTRKPRPDPWAPFETDMVLKDREFYEGTDRELLSITSRDGLTLKGWFYDRGSALSVILCHGYRGGPEELTGIASRVYGQGMNVLLIYQRAHGQSDGSSFTMGVREKEDVAAWAAELARMKPDGKIALFGWSMGGNTVMGTVGEALPDNVICAVEDAGYEDLYSQLLFSCQKSMPRLPAKRFFTNLMDLYCRLFRGFSLHEPRQKALSRCRIPMLFIHGTNDDVVPYDNLDICYGACASNKLRSSYARAIHVGSCGSDPERYFSELFSFIENSAR